MTDGSVGVAQTLAGPAFTIPESLGRRAGTNLFHSFEQFNVRTGESATFTGGSGIRAVIARVTGGSASQINGRLSFAGGLTQADLWLLNPAGIAFGPGASLDLPGSFHAAAADRLDFADGTSFAVGSAGSGAFSVASPRAFGFAGPQPGSVSVNGSQLRVALGRTLALAGGDVDVSNGAQLIAFGGDIVLAGAASGSVVPVDSPPDTAPAGSVRVDGSSLRTTGDGGGNMRIDAAQVDVVNGANLFVSNVGNRDAEGGIVIRAGQVRIISSLIQADGFFAGDAGDISVFADTVALDTAAKLSAQSGFGNPSATGAGGDINISSRTLDLRDRATLLATAFAQGDAGNISLDVSQSISLDGTITTRQDTVANIAARTISPNPDARPGRVTVRTGELRITNGAGVVSETVGAARGSDIDVVADRVLLLDGGVLTSATFATGTAGDIAVTSPSITIGGVNENNKESGIVAASAKQNVQNARGHSGDISIRGGSLSIAAGGRVRASTNNPGDGGFVDIAVDDLRLLPGGTIVTITVNQGSGDAGDTFITARTVRLDSGAVITSSTKGSGNAGAINIAARTVRLDSDATITSSTSSSGTGGSINITAGSTVDLRPGAVITVSSTSPTTTAAGDAGSIFIDAGNRLMMNGAAVTTATTAADGGSIAIKAKELVLLRGGAAVTTSVAGSVGNGGNISIDPRFVVLEDGAIQANAFQGAGGNISIRADNFLSGPNSVVEASSQLGIDGNISIDTPDTDASAGLAVLSSAFGDASERLQTSCAARGGQTSATFTGVGRGRVPLLPGTAVASQYLNLTGSAARIDSGVRVARVGLLADTSGCSGRRRVSDR